MSGVPQWFQDALDGKEPPPLDPELEAYLTDDDGRFGQCLKHPLVYQIPYIAQFAEQANRALRIKRQEIRERSVAGRWESIVWLYERPYRLDAFMALADHLSDTGYWRLLRSIWTDSENVWQNVEKWVGALQSPRPRRFELMTVEDRRALKAMPEVLTVFRGSSAPGGGTMLSWTLDRERALWFGRRFAKRGKLYTGQIERRKVIAYITERGEDEIVLMPTDLCGMISTRPIRGQSTRR